MYRVCSNLKENSGAKGLTYCHSEKRGTVGLWYLHDENEGAEFSVFKLHTCSPSCWKFDTIFMLLDDIPPPYL